MSSKFKPPKIVLELCSDDDQDGDSQSSPLKNSNVQETTKECTEERRRDSGCPLMMAIMKNKYEDIPRISQAKKKEMNELTSTGTSPIHEASFEGKEECLRELIKCGADVNLTDDESWTPLHAAVLGGHLGCVSLLIEAGADLFAESHEKQLPFHVAIKKRDDAVIALLAEEMAKIQLSETGPYCLKRL